MLITKGIFERKIPEFNAANCIIEGIELMDEEKFKEFSRDLLKDRDFIKDRQDEMYIDSAGQVHGLLALNMDSGDGILIDSQGYDYPRYTAFLPNIKSYIDNHISMVVDKIIEEATNNSSNGSWVIYFDEIEENHGLIINENNGIGTLLLAELEEREELAELEIGDNCFDMMFYSKHLNFIDDEIEQNMKM
ncbi:DUF6329 domain-containing protein [Tissierella pigra]|uniref:DUF6329 domain-containing protein n=1 Tax=Tissierella pigra TaxID=2607614 RepID=A0A6N7Y3X4_9FIRM|nr:DUF6329 domain-containing protein [Tissierella pigra]MSU03475.1 hypothetical protein [Tissierella pigra]